MHAIQATDQDGVFTPTCPVELTEGQQVTLRVDDGEEVTHLRDEDREFLKQLADNRREVFRKLAE
jgi:predicted DNA-binding antitoxin AbrB/MazE fold protein